MTWFSNWCDSTCGGHFSLSKQDWGQWHNCFPTGLLLFHTACLLGDKCPHPFTTSWRWGRCAPGLLRHRVPLVNKAVLSTCGITRSGRSANSGRPSTSGVELLTDIGIVIWNTRRSWYCLIILSLQAGFLSWQYGILILRRCLDSISMSTYTMQNMCDSSISSINEKRFHIFVLKWKTSRHKTTLLALAKINNYGSSRLGFKYFFCAWQYFSKIVWHGRCFQ